MSITNRGILNRIYRTADETSSSPFPEMEEAAPILMDHNEESIEK